MVSKNLFLEEALKKVGRLFSRYLDREDPYQGSTLLGGSGFTGIASEDLKA